MSTRSGICENICIILLNVRSPDLTNNVQLMHFKQYVVQRIEMVDETPVISVIEVDL
jgi:hypothetical protein